MDENRWAEPKDDMITMEAELSPIIHLLGDLLGEVIRDQVGEEGFQIVEHVRLTAKKIRDGDNKAEQDLMGFIESLTHDHRLIVIKAFSIYFQLNNLAEEWYRTSKNKFWDADPKDPRLDTFKAVMKQARQYHVHLAEFLELLKDVSLKPVWTAHPTEARRLTTLITLQDIFNLIARLRTEKMSPMEEKFLKSRLKEKITILWQSDDFRHIKPTVLDEVRSILYYFDASVFDVVPELYRTLKMHIISTYHDEMDLGTLIDLPPLLHFGSWVGGDRDGHPGVTATVTIQALLLHKRTCLRKYLTKIKTLLKDFSMSLNNISISKELQESIQEDELSFPKFAEISRKLNEHEPYRRKLDFIRIKLENTLEHVERTAEQVGLGRTLVGTRDTTFVPPEIKTFYRTSKEFIEDLLVIRKSLLQNKGKAIAEGTLEDLIVQAKVFRFYLASLDIRQDSAVHEQALGEIFQRVGLPSLKDLDDSEKTKILLSELENPRPLGVDQFIEDLSPMTREVIATLHIIEQAIQYIDSDCIQSYIISMCRGINDILTLMLLMKETNLLKIEEGRVTKALIDLVPLFETKVDLEQSPQVMESLFTNNLYASFLQQRNNIQEIMVGYSDSGKDVGYLESHYRILTAQLKLRDVARQHDIKLRIFHGRGGTISRGGGPTNKALLSQPRELVTDVKVTEQGEVIASNYGNPRIARRYLEQITSAVIQRTMEDRLVAHDQILPSLRISVDPSDEALRRFGELASIARDKYEQLVKNEDHFIDFFLNFTPIDLIERATIGSRPSRRKKTMVKDITSLRAIPWVFSWMQCRLLFPAFFGVGSALELMKKQGKLSMVMDLLHQWQYFETLMDNLQMVLLKTDLITSKRYLRLIKDDEPLMRLYQEIVNEYHRTRDLVLTITNSQELLEKSPELQRSIHRRNPYLDPLNACQVMILKEWREKGRKEEIQPTSLLRALFQTVNGIAAGMRNTG